MNQQPKTRYVTVDEFAKELCVGTFVVYRLIKLRQIPVRKLFSPRTRRTYVLIPLQQALAALQRKYGSNVL
jgi:hypothetical protein